MAALPGISIRRSPLLGEHSKSVLGSLAATAAAPVIESSRIDLANALSGIRVVDFCWVLAGPLGTRILANFGAEVIRVEAGARGMTDRLPPEQDATEFGSFHNIVNTVTVGFGPSQVSVHPGNEDVFVVNALENAVSIIDIPSTANLIPVQDDELSSRFGAVPPRLAAVRESAIDLTQLVHTRFWAVWLVAQDDNDKSWICFVGVSGD